MADRISEELRQPDRLRRLLGDQRIGLDAGAFGHGVLHQPVQADHLRSLQLAASGQRLRGVDAVMQEEFEIELPHVAAGVTGAGGVEPHRRQRVGEAAIDPLDRIERKLRLRQAGIGQIGQRGVALQIGQHDRRLDLGEDALEQRIEHALGMLELRAGQEHGVAGNIGDQQKTLLCHGQGPFN